MFIAYLMTASFALIDPSWFSLLNTDDTHLKERGEERRGERREERGEKN